MVKKQDYSNNKNNRYDYIAGWDDSMDSCMYTATRMRYETPEGHHVAIKYTYTEAPDGDFWTYRYNQFIHEYETMDNLLEYAEDDERDFLIYLNNTDKKTDLKPEDVSYKNGKQGVFFYILSDDTVFCCGIDSKDEMHYDKQTKIVNKIKYTSLLDYSDQYENATILSNKENPVKVVFETHDPDELTEYLNKESKDKNKVFIPLNDFSIWQIDKTVE